MSGTKWKEVYPLYAKDERYINMLGLPGSSPLELFWDNVDELDMELDHKVKGVEKLLSDKSFEVTDKTSLEELEEIIKADELALKIVAGGIEAVYRHVSGILRLERMSTLLSLSSTTSPSGRKPIPSDARSVNNADFRKSFVMH
jgi:hypothetical protein